MNWLIRRFPRTADRVLTWMERTRARSGAPQPSPEADDAMAVARRLIDARLGR